MPTPSPETPQQPTFTPERLLVLVIVSAVLGSNITLTAFAGTDDAPRGNLLVTSFTTMVLLGIVATARHPKSNATWWTTVVNAVGIGLPVAFAEYALQQPEYTGWEPLILLLILYPFIIAGCSFWVLPDRGFPRSVRYYQISSWVFWFVIVLVPCLYFLFERF